MQALIQVILPVFLVVGLGYAAAWRGLMTEAGVDGLMKFAQSFAIPIMLFLALARLDLGTIFEGRMLASFYAGALGGFLAGLLGAHFLFGRDWEDSVAVGFVCLFSNSVLLGLAISERAYGSESLAPNYAIIALHAPFCYLVGIPAMETVRARGAGLGQTALRVVVGFTRNPLILRLYGRGRMVAKGTPEWDKLYRLFDEHPGAS